MVLKNLKKYLKKSKAGEMMSRESLKEKFAWLKNIMFGILVLLVGAYFYYDLQNWEQVGGTRRINKFVLMVYDFAGKEGVLVIFILGALSLFYSAYKSFMRR